MDFYKLDVHNIKRQDYELLGPLFGGSAKAYVQSLLANRDGTDNSFQQTDTLLIGDAIAGEDKYSPGVSGELRSMLGLIDGGNYWESRTNHISPKGFVPGFEQTSDLGMTAGGQNGSGKTNVTEQYTNSSNSWASKANMNIAFDGSAAFSLTSELGLVASGGNASGYNVWVESFANSANTWTSKTNSPQARGHVTGISLTSDLGLRTGGYISSAQGTVERYTFSGNSWSGRTAKTATFGSVGFSLSTDLGVSASGTSVSTERYSDSANAWTTRANTPNGSSYTGGFTLSGSSGLQAGGNVSDFVCKFSDSDNVWTIKPTMQGIRGYYGGFSLATGVGIAATGGDGVGLNTTVERFKDIINSSSTQHQNNSVPEHDVSIVTNPLTDTTDQIKAIVVSVFYNKKDDLDVNGVWQNRTAGIRARLVQDGGFGLTSDVGIITSGYYGSYTTETDKYQDSINAWISKTANPTAQQAASAFTLTSDLGIYAGGFNGGANGYITTTSRFSDASNGWATRGTLSTAQYDRGGFEMTSDLGCVAGGNNGSGYKNNVERFSESGNAWSNRTAMTNIRNAPGAATVGSNGGIVCGGSNGSVVAFVEKYSDSGNSWSSEPTISEARNYLQAFDLPDVVLSGGTNSGGTKVTTTEMYSLSSSSWSNKQGLPIGTRSAGSFGLGSDGIAAYGQTSNFVNSTYKYLDTDSATTANPTVDINLTGDKYTFDLTGQALDTLIDLESLQNAGAWTALTPISTPKYFGAGFGLTTDLVVNAGGYGQSAYHSSAERYSVTSDAWTSRTSLNYDPYQPAGFKLTSDLGIVSGGLNGVHIGNADRYSDTGNSWTARTAGPASNAHSSINLTTDLGLLAGGSNAVGYVDKVDRYSDTGNSWTARTALNGSARNTIVGISQTTNLGVVVGGQDGTGFYNTVEQYSDSGNSWSFKVGFPKPVRNGAAFKLTDNKGMYAGGEVYDSSNRIKNFSSLYDNSLDSWTSRDTLPESITGATSNLGLDANVGMFAAGYSAQGGVGKANFKYEDASTSGINALTLKFNLNRDTAADVWQARTDCLVACYMPGNTTIEGGGLVMGGQNGTQLNTNQHYIEGSNIWTAKNTMLQARQGLTAFSITKDLCFNIAGHYGGTYYGSTERYSKSSDAFLNRGSRVGATFLSGAVLTSDTGLSFGGNNASVLNLTYRLNHAANSWTARGNMITGRYDHAASSVDSNTVVSGFGYSSSNLSSLERFTESANSWIARNSDIYARSGAVSGASTANGSYFTNGYNAATITVNRKFVELTNTWVTKRTSPYHMRYTDSFSINEHQFIAPTGHDISYISNVSKYTEGETSFEGFAVQIM